MTQVMTTLEMERQFDSEWVLVADPEFNDRMEVIGGQVLFHSQDKEEVYQKDRELHPQSAAYVYTGPVPENVLINL